MSVQAEWCRRNRAKGLCSCGRERTDDKKTCKTCRARRKRHEDKKRAARRCADCPKSAVPGTRRCAPHQERVRAYQKARRLRAIVAYGGRCKCCGEDEPTFLAIDHVFDDGAEERRPSSMKGGNTLLNKLEREGYPKDRYQLLCHNCNQAKRFGVCPHKRAS